MSGVKYSCPYQHTVGDMQYCSVISSEYKRLFDEYTVRIILIVFQMLSVVSAGATAGVGGMDRLRGRGAARDLTASSRDHQVRLHTVHTDIAINLPPSISLPDGEEHPFSSRLHLRDTEQVRVELDALSANSTTNSSLVLIAGV